MENTSPITDDPMTRLGSGVHNAQKKNVKNEIRLVKDLSDDVKDIPLAGRFISK